MKCGKGCNRFYPENKTCLIDGDYSIEGLDCRNPIGDEEMDWLLKKINTDHPEALKSALAYSFQQFQGLKERIENRLGITKASPIDGRRQTDDEADLTSSEDLEQSI